MDLNLFSLRVFLTVADCKSFTATAEALFLSQPAVSLQIQKIEQLFQTPLIRNSSGSIRLTAAGETLQKHARKFVMLQQETVNDMWAHSPFLQNKLKIGACCIGVNISCRLDWLRSRKPTLIHPYRCRLQNASRYSTA